MRVHPGYSLTLRGRSAYFTDVAEVERRRGGTSINVLARRMLDIGLRPGQALFVADARGRRVFHTSRQEITWEERDLSRLQEVQEALAGGTVRSTDFRGLTQDDRRIAALVPTAQHGWLVGVTWSAHDAFAEGRQVHRLQLAAFVTLALLVRGGTWALAT